MTLCRSWNTVDASHSSGNACLSFSVCIQHVCFLLTCFGCYVCLLQQPEEGEGKKEWEWAVKVLLLVSEERVKRGRKRGGLCELINSVLSWCFRCYGLHRDMASVMLDEIFRSYRYNLVSVHFVWLVQSIVLGYLATHSLSTIAPLFSRGNSKVVWCCCCCCCCCTVRLHAHVQSRSEAYHDM